MVYICSIGSSFPGGRIVNTPISLFRGVSFKRDPGLGTEPTVCPVWPQVILSLSSMRQLLLLSILTPTTTVAHELQSLDTHRVILTPVCDSVTDTSKAWCRVSKALGYIFVYSCFIWTNVLTVTDWSILRKMERLGSAHFSAPTLTVSN